MESATATTALALLTQVGQHLRQAAESERRLAEANALIEGLQGELCKERETRLGLAGEVAQYQEELREAREAIESRDARVRAASQEMEELQKRMARAEEREADLRRTLEESKRQVGSPSRGPPAGAKRKRVADPTPGEAGGPDTAATPPAKKSDAPYKKSSLRHHIKAIESGFRRLEQQLEEEIGTSSTLRRQLEDERQRSAAAERRAGHLNRSISRFAEGLEPALPEVPLSEAPPAAIIVPDDSAGAAERPEEAGPIEEKRAGGKTGGSNA